MSTDELVRQPWFCLVTGHPVGTDTRMVGAPPCQCQVCRLSEALAKAESRGYAAVGTGISERDWFAGCALIGMLAQVENASRQNITPEATARAAYRMADAMIAVRDQ